jgi:type IV pilus assembly protein PilC
MTISSLLKSLRRVPQSQKLFFVEHLRVMLKAGISLASAMKTLALQADNRTFREILLDIYKNIEKGNNFSNSLANYPRVFDDLFVNMIRAGEATGKLEDALERLYIQIKKNYELKSKIKGALIYPTIILIAMVVIGIGVIVFVIPRVAPLFTEVGATLPLATRILITISEFIVNHGVFSAIAAIVLIAAVVQLMNNKTARHYFDLALLKLPIISPIIKKINLALFARTLSSLIKTDIPIVQTFQITSHVMSNEVYRDAIAQSAEKIKKGIAIKDAIKKYPELFSPVVLQMIAVGEETGSLDIILDELASFYEEEVSQIMNNLPSIIEPIIILLLGIGVAWIAIAVIMPIYSLAEQI